MIEVYSDKEIHDEISNSENDSKYRSFSGRNYPIEYLNPREFELLTYFVFKKDISIGLHSGVFDIARLMKGTSDRGRDILLQLNGKNVGILQCKRFESLITRPGLAREILKFILHSLQDKSLIHDVKCFKYYFTALRGFNEPATKLISNFNEEILNDKNLVAWVNEVILDNESIKIKDYKEVEDGLKEILGTITIEPLTADELDMKLKNYKEIVPIFFEVEKVASEEMLRKVFGEFMGFKNDEDLEKLRVKLQNIPSEKRMNFGLFDIYGYDLTFYKKIAKDREFIFKLAEIQSKLNQKFIDYLNETIQKYVLIFISGRPEVSPFTKQIITPYLFNKYALMYHINETGKFMASLNIEKNEFSVSKVQTIEEHKAKFLELGEKFLKRDFSEIVGDSNLIELKIWLLTFIHSEFETVQEMSDRFDYDIKILMPILETIEKEIENIVPKNSAIIFGNGGLGDTEHDIKELFDKVKKLN